jgi:phosphopantothenoylcysteine decarboxylase/phosphopantothenate--cysteine ligase
MHEAMYENAFIQENVKKLQRHVTFVGPNIDEGKAKVAEPGQVLDAAIAVLAGSGPLAGKKILITAGSTVEHIDPVRVITNQSSGKMGAAIASEAEKMGAIVTVVYGHGTASPAGRIVRVSTSAEMRDAVVKELKNNNNNNNNNYDVAIMAAAVADYTPAKRSAKKIETRNGAINVSLVPTAKIVDDVKKITRSTFLVAFKADHDVSDTILVDKAYNKLKECGADLVVANDIGRKGSTAGSDDNEVFIVDKERKVVHVPLGSKQAVARRLLEIVSRSLKDD